MGNLLVGRFTGDAAGLARPAKPASEIKLFFEEFVRRVREINVVPGSVDYLPTAFVNGVNRAEVELVLG